MEVKKGRKTIWEKGVEVQQLEVRDHAGILIGIIQFKDIIRDDGGHFRQINFVHTERVEVREWTSNNLKEEF